MKNIIEKIKKSNIVKLLKFKTIIKDLENKLGDLEEDNQRLIDSIKVLDLDNKKLEKAANKVSKLEMQLKETNKSIKDKTKENKKLEEERINLESKLFENTLELKSVKIQLEEYEEQIKDLKSDRYLIRKIPSGKTPNTNKTKISKPMSSRVVKYMREEHE